MYGHAPASTRQRAPATGAKTTTPMQNGTAVAACGARVRDRRSFQTAGRAAGAEKGRVARGAGEGPAPGPLDSRLGQPGQEPAQPALGPRDGRLVIEEAAVDGAARADRPGGRAHQNAAVVRGAEVVQE